MEFDRGAILNKKPVSPRSDYRIARERATECYTRKETAVLPESRATECDTRKITLVLPEYATFLVIFTFEPRKRSGFESCSNISFPLRPCQLFARQLFLKVIYLVPLELQLVFENSMKWKTATMELFSRQVESVILAN